MDSGKPSISRVEASTVEELAGELAQLGRERFTQRYPHPFLVIVYAPPREGASAESKTEQTDAKDLRLDELQPVSKRVIPLVKTSRNNLKSKIVCGRDNSCDVIIRSSKISRQHAAFVTKRKGRYELTDLGSANGTVLNGARLGKNRSLKLKSGDMIAMWRFLFQYVELEAFLIMLGSSSGRPGENPIPFST
jgi:hypothetical protein